MWSLSAAWPLAAAAGSQPPGPTAAGDPGRPRQYTDGSAKLVLQQPQVETEGLPKTYSTLCREPNGDKEGTAGLGRDVHRVGALSLKLLPAYPSSLALDRVLAYLERDVVKARQTAVAMETPPILVNTQPAILVIIDGEPLRVDVDKIDLQKVVNTNWDLFCDKKGSRYYLRDDKVWLSASGLAEGWSSVTKLPKDFSKLPATEQYADSSRSRALGFRTQATHRTMCLESTAATIYVSRACGLPQARRMVHGNRGTKFQKRSTRFHRVPRSTMSPM